MAATPVPNPDPESVPLAVWPCAQTSAQYQRAGRYLPASAKNAGKMLPELARRILTAYSAPGDFVLDPMCGIGTTLIEGATLGRRCVGVDLEARWADLADANLDHILTGEQRRLAEVRVGEARHLPEVLGELAGTVDLIATSPPYAQLDPGGPQRPLCSAWATVWCADVPERPRSVPGFRFDPCRRGGVGGSAGRLEGQGTAGLDRGRVLTGLLWGGSVTAGGVHAWWRREAGMASTTTVRAALGPGRIRHRKSVRRLTPQQLRWLREAVAGIMPIRDERGYQYHAGHDGLPLPYECVHHQQTPLFLPWHRAYLYFFERVVGSAASSPIGVVELATAARWSTVGYPDGVCGRDG